mmetsp:Transcript_35010/g.68123  ORF Transcript_35010/g.68123 Transcript_35010/m.68123 type:complete len:237 (-) Transcript_35010:17-727(-)
MRFSQRCIACSWPSESSPCTDRFRVRIACSALMFSILRFFDSIRSQSFFCRSVLGVKPSRGSSSRSASNSSSPMPQDMSLDMAIFSAISFIFLSCWRFCFVRAILARTCSGSCRSGATRSSSDGPVRMYSLLDSPNLMTSPTWTCLCSRRTSFSLLILVPWVDPSSYRYTSPPARCCTMQCCREMDGCWSTKSHDGCLPTTRKGLASIGTEDTMTPFLSTSNPNSCSGSTDQNGGE